jgi:hypothetical protein
MGCKGGGDFLFIVMTLIHEVQRVKYNVIPLNIYELYLKFIRLEVSTAIVLKTIHLDVHTNAIFNIWKHLYA